MLPCLFNEGSVMISVISYGVDGDYDDDDDDNVKCLKNIMKNN
jgi:hypothetical protein